MYRRKGFQAERELVKKLWRYGFAVLRGPASGSGARTIFYPDLLAIYKGRIFVIEVKYRSTDKDIYIDKEKINKLKDFAQRAHAEILIAVKIKNKGWFVVPLEHNCMETQKGCRIALREHNIIPINEFINNIVNENLNKYITK